MRIPSFYFPWLQKDNPTGMVERLPVLNEKGETSVPGIYCIGDLTGIPLIKLAAESGFNIIEQLDQDSHFQAKRKSKKNDNIYDLVIIGAGPAGISAGIKAQQAGYSILIIESSKAFNTIRNFPAGKPIHVVPTSVQAKSALTFSDGTKETLLNELLEALNKQELPLNQGEMIQEIIKENDLFTIKSSKSLYQALRVIVAIGKSGNTRMLNVPGDNLEKVFTRLNDPADFVNQDVLVVGGGDSAVEAAVALAQNQARVSFSYRKSSLSRPKEHNSNAFNQLVKEKKIIPYFNSTVQQIENKQVTLKQKEQIIPLKNDAVLGLIGAEIPIKFFQRSNIKMEGEKNSLDKIKFAALLFFSAVLYFGKSAPITAISSVSDFFLLPLKLVQNYWPYALKGLAAWISFVSIIVTGGYILFHFLKNRKQYFTSQWNNFKFFYFLTMAVLFCYLYLSYNLFGAKLFGYDTGYWYSAMYSLTIISFGFRRIKVKPTGYIKRQTITLMLIQVLPLFILPVYIFPWLGSQGILGDWVMENVFPNNSYWRSYGLILAWPLFLHNLALGEPILFWLILSAVQSFVIIPLIIYIWGKGSYCGWICSCGALAETLGDEYRMKAPHGPQAKKADNWGQVILWFAIVVTLFISLKTWFNIAVPILPPLQDLYSVVVDIILAGVLGVGAYFFMSGRVWCRFFCPLAALMHIYCKFSLYRIRTDKKRCISCNICTKVCHMGIDVMGYANKGIPMNDVECVRCSACIVNCPMQALTFSHGSQIDPDNVAYKKQPIPLPQGWPSGLNEEDINLLNKEAQTF